MKLKISIFILALAMLSGCINKLAFVEDAIVEASKAYEQKEYQKAKELYEKLAAAGNADAKHMIAWMHEHGEGVEKDLKKSANWYKDAAEQGHVKSQYALASMYESGWGVEKNREEAKKWYRKAAEGGSWMARYHLIAMAFKK